MTTRTFIKSILLASLAPAAFIPKQADRFKWKREQGVWVVNPEWINGPLQYYYVKALDMDLCGEPYCDKTEKEIHRYVVGQAKFPYRFYTLEDMKQWKIIQPMIFQRA